MLASVLTSEAGGRASQLPVLAGGLKPHIFFSNNIRSGMSKFADETDERIVGYSFCHCTEFRILFFLSDWSVGCAGGRVKSSCRAVGGCIMSNLSLKA